VPRVLRELPFFEQATRARLPDGSAVPVLGDQIVFWASIAPPELQQPRELRPFPVSFDTGFTGEFCVREGHLLEWSGLRPRDLVRVGHARVDDQFIPLRAAALWIHPNRPGSRDAFDGRPAYPLPVTAQVMVWPSAMPGARRLPLFGVGEIRRAGLRAVVDGRRRRVWLGTPWRFWPFG